MELQDMPIVPEREADLKLEDRELDRIAFELWQRGSLPKLAESMEAELEEFASHASCL